MAGVGRRGFAAAARAAMFTQPSSGMSYNSQPPNRRADPPRFLDTEAASRCMFIYFLTNILLS